MTIAAIFCLFSAPWTLFVFILGYRFGTAERKGHEPPPTLTQTVTDSVRSALAEMKEPEPNPLDEEPVPEEERFQI